jgi:transposase
MNLTKQERDELEAVIRKCHGSAALAPRARCVLLWADGERRVDIRTEPACNDGFVTRWTRAFELEGLAGLVSLHPGRAPERPVAKLEARVLNKTLRHKPSDGSTHWSSRKLAAELGDVSFSAVQRIWRKHGLQPYRLDRHLVSNDRTSRPRPRM